MTAGTAPSIGSVTQQVENSRSTSDLCLRDITSISKIHKQSLAA
jgi:hypothetical protein